MSVLNLPEPTNWAKTGKLPLWVSLGLFVLLSYAVVRAILAAVRGNYLTTFLLAGLLALPVLMVVALLAGAAGKTKTRITSDATGFTVWPDKQFSMLYFTGLTVTAPSAILFAILLPRGAIDIPTTRGLQLFLPVLFAAGAVVAVTGLVAGWRRKGVGYLKFTPKMVEIADVLRTRVLEWNDIADIKDHSETKKTGRSVVLCLRDGTEEVIGGLNLYVPTGIPLYWLVRHYWLHPEDRMELADARAAERFREGSFDVA